MPTKSRVTANKLSLATLRVLACADTYVTSLTDNGTKIRAIAQAELIKAVHEMRIWTRAQKADTETPKHQRHCASLYIDPKTGKPHPCNCAPQNEEDT